MRALTTYVLIGLLAACPFVCGAAEGGYTPHRHQVDGGQSDHPHGPAHCPEGDESCICDGAVLSGSARVSDVHACPIFDLFTAFLHTAYHPATHLACGNWQVGSPDALGRTPSLALLQTYRC